MKTKHVRALLFNKEDTRKLFRRSEANITGIIYNGLINSTPKNKIVKQIKAELTNLDTKIGGFRPIEINLLWINAFKVYNQVAKTAFSAFVKIKRHNKQASYQELYKMRSEAAFEALKKEVIYSEILKKEGNKVLNIMEADVKTKSLRYLVEAGRKKSKQRSSDEYSPFYLCSFHQNCAMDHIDYQGKMYYDEKWRDYVCKEDEKKIEAYIHNRKLQSIQWVTGAPIYMTTRPNCKHHFISIPLREALYDSPNALLNKHSLVFKDEEKPNTYADRAYRAYSERLEELTMLSDIMSNKPLQDMIVETKQLVAKWGVAIRGNSSRADTEQ